MSFTFRCALIFVDTCAHTLLLEVIQFFNWHQSLVHSEKINFLSVLYLTSIFIMSQTLNSVPAFDGSNYGYWKACMRFFLKSIDCWGIVETGWTKPEDTTPELVHQKNARLSNDKALHALCQALSPSEFAKISNCESAKAAW
jgi:hypothetical protein